MPTSLRLIGAAALLAAALPLRAAGLVEVAFVEPRGFTDAGPTAAETERTTRELAAVVRSFAPRLPDGQTLRVEFTDVDLAGSVRPGSRGDIRVLRGGADVPVLEMRWALRAGERVLASGEDRLVDLDYLGTPPHGRSGAGLPYEERLLRRWFDDRVAVALAQ